MYVFENDRFIGAHYFLIKKGVKLKAASLPSLPRLLPLPGTQKEILPVSWQCLKLPSFRMSMKNLRSSINRYSQAINWNSTHQIIFTGVTLPAQKPLCFGKKKHSPGKLVF